MSSAAETRPATLPSADRPAWFQAAIDDRPEEHTLEVRDGTVTALTWGSVTAPTLVLVHGGGAHARWWSFLGPHLAKNHRVVAVDLSGHGDSCHREGYDSRIWAEEVHEAAERLGGTGRPIVAGHSMGGTVTALVASLWGNRLAGAIIMDTRIRRPDPHGPPWKPPGEMFRNPKTYADAETAADSFKLVPAQPCENAWLVRHVAAESLRAVDGGWTWKFDPRVFTHRSGPRSPEELTPVLRNVDTRVAMITGEDSVVSDPDTLDHMIAQLRASPGGRQGVPLVTIPAAHHHLMFDQPLALLTAMRSIIATWRTR